jgi:peroxiredoxin Q/BCP
MALKIGDQLPEFSAMTDQNKLLQSQDITGKPLVIYFYPKDDTPGCTAEACSFRDQFQDFQDLGAEVLGISSDSVESHQKFKKKHRLPFTLISDPDRKLEKSFGVKRDFLGLVPGRVTYVFGIDGKLKYQFSSQLNAKAHVKEALEALNKD